MLAAIWLLVTLPLAWLAAWEMEVTVNSLSVAGKGSSLPMLTNWYRDLGTIGIYLTAAAPGALMLALHPLRSRRIVTVTLTLAVAASIHFVFLGLLAALLAFVKVYF
ncbi:MAG: hypothetical protein H6935_15245 [Thiobacillus sp.]|nr:hypothetical protein [Thiobacillus sp.]